MSESSQKYKKILVAPLDWGLGHAARSISVITMLLQNNCKVWIATSGAQEKLLKEAFPSCQFVKLPGYGVKYGKGGVLVNILKQIPAIRHHIRTEHQWLQNAIAQYGIDGVISDNRYGLYSKQIPSVLITHQLALQLPAWCTFISPIVRKALYRYINTFGECWVPDLPNKSQSLAGLMSHPKILPKIPVHYIGWLSRFKNNPQSTVNREPAIMIILSGPEPQRTLLENKLLKQIKFIQKPFWLVRGLPGEIQQLTVPAHVKAFNHLATKEMELLMQTCSLLVCRSGYSTLMDAFTLNTPLACIPTPGQTEQIYLAKKLEASGMAVLQTQQNLNLPLLIDYGLKLAKNKKALLREKNEQWSLLEIHVIRWLEKIESIYE